jgi:SAM-dependent methyltransferase
MVRAMLEIGLGGGSATSAAGWVRMRETIPLRIAEINRIEGLHDQLAILPGLHASDFYPGGEPGSTVDGVRHENLSSLTYADASFDLVLTSETLEHVPDLDRALSEIRRVLVPGGFHLFTIPLLPTQHRTFARARIDDDGRGIELAPPIAHPGGDWGYPVFTEFGLDAVERLRAAGFETEMRYGPVTEDDLLQVFVTRRPMN